MQWENLLSTRRIKDTGVSDGSARSEFERDYDRVIFSTAFRKLQDKTQVFPLPTHDFVHTRLTHSLEVSVVARSLGKFAGDLLSKRYPEVFRTVSPRDVGSITAVAALAHDIGNPPFGHSGERAISEFFLSHHLGQEIQSKVTPEQYKELCNFEGNAQGFRVLTKIEKQNKLTFATLGAFSKYPCPIYADRQDTRKNQKKYGFYLSEAAIFKQMATELGLPVLGKHTWGRHPLVFLTEAADDICYHIIDMEDAVRLGILPMDTMLDLVAPLVSDKFKPEKFNQIKSNSEKAGLLRALSISKLIDQCIELFADVETSLLDGSWDKSLAVGIKDGKTLKEIGRFSFEHIYKSRQVLDVEVAGYQVIQGILEELIKSLLDNFKGTRSELMLAILPEEIKSQIQADDHTGNRVQYLLDAVSSMTDRAALAFYRNLKGIEVTGFNTSI